MLPGMVRAVQRTLIAAWRADLAFETGRQLRLADLAELDQRVRSGLPLGCLVPPDLRDAAVSRVAHAPQLLGAVELVELLEVDAVWHPLLKALSDHVPVAWRPADTSDRHWFPGTIEGASLRPPPPPMAVVCADPRAEVVEALRWVRALMSSGVHAVDIAISAVSCGPWDATMHVLAQDARLPIHFTHGVEALESSAGQSCAALADILLRGLSQGRLRRLLRCSHRAREGLPWDWAKGLEASAGLFTEAQWSIALARARDSRIDGALAEEILLPRLKALSEGISAAEEAGPLFLSGPALQLWLQALRVAPAEALELSLQGLRVADDVSPGAAVSWGPASHLAAAPRSYVRLLGLTSRAWPRAEIEDPLLPNHVLPRDRLNPLSRSELDVRLFNAIQHQATGELVLSRSRRSAEGSLLAPSRLFPSEGARTLAKARTPTHAFSLADRLLARPLEARDTPALSLSQAAWRAWQAPQLTPWDGAIPVDDPVVRDALAREQSATSLRRLVRDQLGFVWRYALGMSPADIHTDVLSLDRRDFGTLVHAIIQAAVAQLEPSPGLNRATADELTSAVFAAGQQMEVDWPAERPVPPPLLWRRTIDEAVRLAGAGLAFDQGLQPGTRSWSEVAFGWETAATPPWDVDAEVLLGGQSVGGVIDRLDIRSDGMAARVTDYKTGAMPRSLGTDSLAGGAELQRVIYAAAVRRRLPEIQNIVSRLVYLRDGPVAHALSGDALEVAIANADRLVAMAAAQLSRGIALPGPDARERFNDMRLALPAEFDLYMLRKARAFNAAAGELSMFWGTEL